MVLLLFVSTCVVAQSQRTIIVIDKLSREPISNASVACTLDSVRKSTSQQGELSLPGSFRGDYCR